ncbi:MAG: J domain-containing protein [Alphaproteobacteria bacterium]|nr:J domain-containing protein [Alphaproteobacteria bacterium]
MTMQEAASLLGVKVDATPLQIKSAYRKLMLKHHPDKGGEAEYAAKLNIARDTLMARFSKR